MGKKMKLIPFLHKPTQPPPSSSPWPWPNCGIPKTLSFRDETISNSVHVATESSLINSSVCDSSADTTELQEDEYFSQGLDQTIENVIREVRSSSERLFFDDHIGEATSCIVRDQLQLAKTDNNSTNTSSCMSSSDNKLVAMEMDSRDPFEDFKKSMEEVVEAGGFDMKDWDSLDQLLSWYLYVNCKSNHGYIVGAFIDLLVSFQISSASNTSFSSPTSSSCDNDHKTSSDSSSATLVTPISDLSFSSSCSNDPCLLTLTGEEEEEEDEDAGLDHRLTRNISETN